MLGVAMACESRCVKGEDATDRLMSGICGDVFYLEYAYWCPTSRQAAGLFDKVPACLKGEVRVESLPVAPVFHEDQQGRVVAIPVDIVGDTAIFGTRALTMGPAERDQAICGVWPCAHAACDEDHGRDLFNRAAGHS